jgi:hypothetical protein
VVEVQHNIHQHSAVLPALHRRGLQERGAAANCEQDMFELLFRVICSLNIPTWSNPEDGSKHTDTWTCLFFRTFYNT